MDRLRRALVRLARFAPGPLCACLGLILAGCQAEAIFIPRELIEPPPHVESLPSVTGRESTSFRPVHSHSPSFPGDTKPWIREMLASRQGELTLRDALLIAIDNSEVVRTAEGTAGFSQVGATQYDVPVFDERLRAEQARFDPNVSVGYLGSQISQPANSYFGPGILYNPRQDEGTFSASVAKPLVTGGSLSASHNPSLSYLYYPDGADGFNPAYSSQLTFLFQQPLLKDFGPDFTMAPIRVARLRRDQSILDVKQAMLAQVRSIEEAYWDLQAARANLEAVDYLLPLLKEAVRIEEARLENEIVTEGEVARSRSLENQFQQQRVQFATEVANKQFRLANLMGISRADVIGFVPVDPPVRQRLFVNPETSLDLALHQRPDLIRQRLAVQIRDVNMTAAHNQSKPQVDALALWRTSGLGDRLDDALSQASDFKFNDWSLGLTYTVPLGLRAARATLRATELDQAREQALLRQLTENTEFQLAELARELDRAWAEYTLALERVDQTFSWMAGAEARFENPPPVSGGGSQQSLLTVVLNDYQQAMRAYIEAVMSATQALARYNSLLARLEEAQGTLLEKRNINMCGPNAAAPDWTAPGVPTEPAPAQWPVPVAPDTRTTLPQPPKSLPGLPR